MSRWRKSENVFDFFSFLWYVNFPEESRFKLQQFTRTLNNSELNLTYVKVYVCANGDTAQ